MLLMNIRYTIETVHQPGLSPITRLPNNDLAITVFETEAGAKAEIERLSLKKSWFVQHLPEHHFPLWVEIYVMTRNVTHVRIVDHKGGIRIVPIRDYRTNK